MTSRDVATVIRQRLDELDIQVAEEVLAGSVSYLRLLQKWNRTINLTALSFDEPHLSGTVDKLLMEPLIGASLLESVGFSPREWFDLGSGGGSPAIPMRLSCPSGRQTMVEARDRKCAFLREVVRQLGLEATVVLNSRFEQIPASNNIDLLTVRAVRLDESVGTLTMSLLAPKGFVLSFGSEFHSDGLRLVASRALPDLSTLFLSQLVNVPRGTI
ncbi:MAG: RsmG family class I SAM-dependent methyltransferase [Vicinamibacterales bacterium]